MGVSEHGGMVSVLCFRTRDLTKFPMVSKSSGSAYIASSEVVFDGGFDNFDEFSVEDEGGSWKLGSESLECLRRSLQCLRRSLQVRSFIRDVAGMKIP